jgi:hypothetical protein
MCVILLPNPGTPSSFFVTNEVIILFSCADCTNDQVSILRANSLIPASKSGENGRKNRGITIEAYYMWRVDNFSCVVCVDRASTLQVEDGYAGSECPQMEKMRRCVCYCFFCSVEVSWVVVETS